MAELAHENGGNGGARIESRRRSLLELAPLELDCMNTLWPIGEGTVREIRDLLAPRTPRAYTTIMTIMDRLARKGIVERRKAGRAYIYKPSLSANEARDHALGKVVESFFGGSREDAVAFLNGAASAMAPGNAGASIVPLAAASSSASLAAISSQAALPTPSPAGSPAAMSADGSRGTKARAASASASGSASAFSVSAAPPASTSMDDTDAEHNALAAGEPERLEAAEADAVAALPTEERGGESSRMDDTLL